MPFKAVQVSFTLYDTFTSHGVIQTFSLERVTSLKFEIAVVKLDFALRTNPSSTSSGYSKPSFNDSPIIALANSSFSKELSGRARERINSLL